MCLVNLIYFSTCNCIVVSFADPDAPREDALCAVDVGIPCGMPEILSVLRTQCEYSGLFCPQRRWYSSMMISSHSNDCLHRPAASPKMVVAGFLMHFDWFKGFMGMDLHIKRWGLLESTYGISYTRLYDNADPSSYFNKQYPGCDKEYPGAGWPLALLEPYIGKCSWVFPMYVLLAAAQVEVGNVRMFAKDYEEDLVREFHDPEDSTELKVYIGSMNALDYRRRINMSEGMTHVTVQYRREIRIPRSGGLVEISNPWDGIPGHFRKLPSIVFDLVPHPEGDGFKERDAMVLNRDPEDSSMSSEEEDSDSDASLSSFKSGGSLEIPDSQEDPQEDVKVQKIADTTLEVLEAVFGEYPNDTEMADLYQRETATLASEDEISQPYEGHENSSMSDFEYAVVRDHPRLGYYERTYSEPSMDNSECSPCPRVLQDIHDDNVEYREMMREEMMRLEYERPPLSDHLIGRERSPTMEASGANTDHHDDLRLPSNNNNELADIHHQEELESGLAMLPEDYIDRHISREKRVVHIIRWARSIVTEHSDETPVIDEVQFTISPPSA